MKIGIASDHGGFQLKGKLCEHFKSSGFIDLGPHDPESCDYPDFAEILCRKIQSRDIERGILICGTGIGMSITANRMQGIRAALCCNEFMAKMSRRHNDANVLALGARVIGDALAISIVETWLETPFDGGRHRLRLDKIDTVVSLKPPTDESDR